MKKLIKQLKKMKLNNGFTMKEFVENVELPSGEIRTMIDTTRLTLTGAFTFDRHNFIRRKEVYKYKITDTNPNGLIYLTKGNGAKTLIDPILLPALLISAKDSKLYIKACKVMTTCLVENKKLLNTDNKSKIHRSPKEQKRYEYKKERLKELKGVREIEKSNQEKLAKELSKK